MEPLNYLLMKAHTQLNRRIMADAAALGLSPGQPKVLECLAECGECNQKAIARYCEIEQATVGSILLRMERDGLVRRVQKDGNRRALYVSLTPRGLQMAAQVQRIFQQADARAAAELSAEECLELQRLLQRCLLYTSVILDEKTALMDTADVSVGAQFLENVAAALNGRGLDYLVIDHMEPDHAAMIEAVLLRWPGVQIVCNAKTVPMLKAFFPGDAAAIEGALLVKEGDTLELGKHSLSFVMAPMVHWPEVMMAFDTATGTLFSADAFGTFGALGGSLFRCV